MIKYIVGDCRKVLKTLPDQSVHMIITSPPYWGLRDYGLPPLVWDGDEDCQHVWGKEQITHQRGKVGGHSTLDGGLQAGGDGRLQEASQGQWCQRCGAWRGSLGLEPSPDLYVSHLVGIFKEARRVLRDDGTLWLNLGDTYSRNPQKGDNSGWGKHAEWVTDELPLHARPCPDGLPEKNLVGIPWRVAFALQADGWWLRSDVIWHKPNCMPESVKDRPTCSHEYLFLLAKSQRYFYDADAIREPNQSGPSDIKKMVEQQDRIGGKHKVLVDPFSKASEATNIGQKRAVGDPTNGRNRRSVWTIATCPFPEAHFATFPPALVEPCIKAGTSERGVCPQCGAPWERVTERVFIPQGDVSLNRGIRGAAGQKPLDASNTWEGYPRGTTQTTTIDWRPTCSCGTDATVPAVVLDPFGGAGTTGLVADQLGHDCILIDLKDEYGEMAERRILGSLGPMFTEVELVAV